MMNVAENLKLETGSNYDLIQTKALYLLAAPSTPETARQEAIEKAENGKQWTTSLNIADVFGKEHRNVIQAIENIECSQEFSRLNFQQIFYTDKMNREQPMFELTRDGFSFLLMNIMSKRRGKGRGRLAEIVGINILAEKWRLVPRGNNLEKKRSLLHQTSTIILLMLLNIMSKRRGKGRGQRVSSIPIT